MHTLERNICMQRVPEKGPGISQKVNIHTIIQDYKPKECTLS